jgi:hypothetical protein
MLGLELQAEESPRLTTVHRQQRMARILAELKNRRLV